MGVGAQRADVCAPWFDTPSAWEHPRDVVGRLRRVLAVALSLTLLGANGAVCAGWAATPEARMACCADADCPMHAADHEASPPAHAHGQASADACCAVSERKQSETSSPATVVSLAAPVLDAGVVLAPSVPARFLRERWRTAAPSLVPPVARHVLLSVFLI